MTLEMFLRLGLQEQLNLLINDVSAENLVLIHEDEVTHIVQYLYGFYAELKHYKDNTVEIRASKEGTEILGKYISRINIEDLFLPFY